jgi:hypothetical protein
MRSLFFVAAAACALAGCDRPASQQQVSHVSPEDRERVQKAAAAAKAAVEAQDAKRTAALVAAATSLAPRPDVGACPIKVPVPDSDEVLGGVSHDLPPDWRSIRADQMMLAPRDAVATTPSVRKKHLLEMIDFETSQLDSSTKPGAVEDALKWITYYGDAKNKAWEMVVVVRGRVDPTLNADAGEFESGAIVGVAYVYSFVDDKVVCAGPVAAESSKLLTWHHVALVDGGDFDLDFDLQNEAFRSAARGLVAAGPSRAAASATATDGGAPGDAGAADARAAGAATRPPPRGPRGSG